MSCVAFIPLTSTTSTSCAHSNCTICLCQIPSSGCTTVDLKAGVLRLEVLLGKMSYMIHLREYFIAVLHRCYAAHYAVSLQQSFTLHSESPTLSCPIWQTQTFSLTVVIICLSVIADLCKEVRLCKVWH